MSLETVKIPVTGMTCGGCARTIERKLASTAGVSLVQVDLAGGNATVQYDPVRTNVSELTAAIEKLGYQVPQR